MSRRTRRSQPEIVELPSATEVERRLEVLGVPQKVLLDAVRRGQNARDFCTKAHPVTYPPSAAWGETNAGIREELGIRGWTFDDEDNIPRVISPDKSIVITAVSGNARTGLRDHEHPASTRRPRRTAGIRIVRQNSQLVLHESLVPDITSETDALDFGPTWFFLYYRNEDFLRSELSLAVKVSDSGNLLKWSERLILPEINLLDGGSPETVSQHDSSLDIDVPVERRAS